MHIVSHSLAFGVDRKIVYSCPPVSWGPAETVSLRSGVTYIGQPLSSICYKGVPFLSPGILFVYRYPNHIIVLFVFRANSCHALCLSVLTLFGLIFVFHRRNVSGAHPPPYNIVSLEIVIFAIGRLVTGGGWAIFTRTMIHRKRRVNFISISFQ